MSPQADEAGNAERVNRGLRIQSQKTRSGRGGAERTDRRRAVPSPLVIVTGIHHQPQPAFDLEPDNIGIEHVTPRGAGQLSCSQSRRHESATGMSERNKAHVVVVVRVCGNAIGHGGFTCAHPKPGTEHPAGSMTFGSQGVSDDDSRGLPHAGKNNAHRVADSHRCALSRASAGTFAEAMKSAIV